MSATPEMIERVARALAVEDSCDPDFVDRAGRIQWTYHVEAARVAIHAMREPTTTMADAGRWPGEDGEIMEAWRAMIDASLSPSTVEAGE